MTVKELINLLLDYPMDSNVYTYTNGEYRPVDKFDIDLDNDKDIVIHR